MQLLPLTLNIQHIVAVFVCVYDIHYVAKEESPLSHPYVPAKPLAIIIQLVPDPLLQYIKLHSSKKVLQILEYGSQDGRPFNTRALISLALM